MSHGGDFTANGSNARAAHGETPLPPSPPIRGVEPLGHEPPAKSPPSSFSLSSSAPAPSTIVPASASAVAPIVPSTAPLPPSLFDSSDAAHNPATVSPVALDPWGAADDTEEDSALPEAITPVPRPMLCQRGGGMVTLPLICMGLAMIACVMLLPMADDLHQLSWEREKLKKDLSHLKEQVRVNEEFLARLTDDPTLAERLAQRQMKVIRDGQRALPVRAAGREEISPFQLVSIPPPAPMPAYQPLGGGLANLVRTPRARLYTCGAGLLLIAAGLVLGHTPRDEASEETTPL